MTGIELLRVECGRIVERWSDVIPLAVIQHMDAIRYLQRRAQAAQRAAETALTAAPVASEALHG
jgi:hypothetical protein